MPICRSIKFVYSDVFYRSAYSVDSHVRWSTAGETHGVDRGVRSPHGWTYGRMDGVALSYCKRSVFLWEISRRSEVENEGHGQSNRIVSQFQSDAPPLHGMRTQDRHQESPRSSIQKLAKDAIFPKLQVVTRVRSKSTTPLIAILHGNMHFGGKDVSSMAYFLWIHETYFLGAPWKTFWGRSYPRLCPSPSTIFFSKGPFVRMDVMNRHKKCS